MKARKRTTIPAFTIASYTACGLLSACFILAVVATWANVSAQLAQGAPVQGNELAIANVVLSGCASYAAFAFLAFAAGTLYHRLDQRTAIATDDGNERTEPEADEEARDEERNDDVDAFVRSADLNRLFGVRQTVTLEQALKSVYVR